MNSLLEKSDIQTLVPKFTQYLESQHWRLLKDNDIVSIWGSPKNQISIRLPNPNNIAEDDVEFTNIALSKLASYLNSSTELVLQAILDTKVPAKLGRISFRIIADDVENGQISFQDGIELFKSTKRFIEDFSKSAWKKSAVLTSYKPEYVTDFINNVKLGQTAHGSYIINIFYPIEQLSIEDDFSQTSFSEIVSQNISSGLSALSSYLAEQPDAPKSAGDFIQKGISTNLCNTLVSFSGKHQHRDLEITLHSIENNVSNQIFSLQNGQVEKIRYIAKKLARDEYFFEKYEVIGKVIERHSLSGNIEEGGKITVKMEIYGKSRNIYINLNPDEYKLANQATNEGKLLQLVGKLSIKKEKGEMSDLVTIRILDNESLPLT
ncbi:hypothetical protein [Mannheimia granulomatis]|uniref:hypothetical protein n=1 Tax=Mannheimia granulomatis TaxID=85402 RepID=UPI00047A25C5|nr:hypothetical protein [Mannheimia granulomatis]QLB18690.1 hypothetical protein A6B41_04115 [Mannheimia granulomatis]